MVRAIRRMATPMDLILFMDGDDKFFHVGVLDEVAATFRKEKPWFASVYCLLFQQSLFKRADISIDFLPPSDLSRIVSGSFRRNGFPGPVIGQVVAQIY